MNFRPLIIIATTLGLIATSAAAGTFTKYSDLVYADRSERNVLDIYLPDGVDTPPLVMWIHSGGYNSGDKDGPSGFRSFLDAGIGIAAMNYRFSNEAIWPAQLEDMRDAFAFLRANGETYGYDGTRLAAFGKGSGGHLAMVIGLDLAADPETRLVAVIERSSAVHFSEMNNDMEAYLAAQGKPASYQRDVDRDQLMGESIQENPELAYTASPLYFLEQLPQGTELPAFLIMHAALDRNLAPGQPMRMLNALMARAPNADIEFWLIPDAHTASYIKLEGPEIMGRVAAFLRRNMDR